MGPIVSGRAAQYPCDGTSVEHTMRIFDGATFEAGRRARVVSIICSLFFARDWASHTDQAPRYDFTQMRKSMTMIPMQSASATIAVA